MREVKTWKVVALLTVMIVLTLVRGCMEENKTHKDYKEAINYRHLIKEYVAKDGTAVNYNTALETDLETLRNVNDSLANYIDNLDVKSVETITIFDTHFQLDTLYLPFDEPIDSVKFIRRFEVDSSSLYMSGEITELGMTIDSMGVSNRIGLTLSYKKTGLFKKELIATVTNSNPLVKIDGISSFVIEDKKKWWKKCGPKVVAGTILGGIVTYKIVK